MKKRNIVKDNRDFSKIINTGRKYWNDAYSMYVYNNNYGDYRFGISVSKKLGNAVVRNKIKRQLRNIIDKYKKLYSKDKDYIIIIRKKYIDLNFQDADSKYIDLINRVNSKEEKKDDEKN